MNLYIFIPGTIFILLFSWFLSIKHGRYHGIARFFSFESIFILVQLNAGVWFLHPLSMVQIASWLLLILSLYVAVRGFLLLVKIGRPDSNFENTSVLVKEGFYRYIRHPLYLSLFLLGTGSMIKDPHLLQILLGILNLAAVWVTSRIEEKEMIARFGDEYRAYMKETKMFIPFIF
jgi:protein-S-isoprenylcysteine O-methyltransferase Ste14